MAFGRAVITFSSFNLPYAGEAPHPHSILRRILRILRRLASREHFGSGGEKKTTIVLRFSGAKC